MEAAVNDRNIRVLHVLVALPRGGKERIVLDECKHGSRVGLKNAVVAFAGGDMLNDFLAAGVDVTLVYRRYPVDLTIIRMLRERIREHDIDVLHTHEPVEGMHALLAAVGFPVAHVMSVHGHLDDAKNRLAFAFLRRRVDRIAPVSIACMQREALGVNPSEATRVSVLCNGCDVSRLQETSAILRTELGLSSSERLAGMISHFVPGKDPLSVVFALQEVLPRIPNLHFVFVGRKDDRFPLLYDECVGMAHKNPHADRIHFLGPRGDIAEVFGSLDLVVLSSVSETFGLAAVEAMVAGVPLLLSSIPAFVEVTRHGRHGHFFRPGDAADLARMMRTLLSDDALRMAHVVDARKWAEESYSLDKHLEELRQLYLGAMEHRSRQQRSINGC